MARITVEDCLEHVENRFHLVMLASKRARQLMRGSAEPTVAWENDKATVVALREIATGHVDFKDAHHADTHTNHRHETQEIHIAHHDHDDDHEDHDTHEHLHLDDTHDTSETDHHDME